MGYLAPSNCRRVVLALQIVFVFTVLGIAHSQGLQSSPYSASSLLRGFQGIDFGSSNNSRVGELQTLPITSGMLRDILPPIPNLQFGYFYNFGSNVSSGRATIDYIRPFHLSSNSVVFGEGHAEFSDFRKTLRGGANSRVDLSVGGGYRRMIGNSTLIGFNGFYDTARLFGKWYNSGGAGFQLAAELPGNDAIDLNFNWYGNLFQRSVIVDAFRNGPRNYDFQAGYSHELWNGGPDFRLSATGYRFDAGSAVYGVNGGAELKSRDGMFVLKYAVGNDKINRTYQTIGAMVNVGFAPDNLLRGESPFSMPQPIFRSPRNLLSWLDSTMSTVRNFSQPASALILAQNPSPPGPTPPGPPTPPAGSYVIYGPNVLASFGDYPTVPPLPDPPVGTSSVTISWAGVSSGGTVIGLARGALVPATQRQENLTPWITVTTTPGHATVSLTFIGAPALPPNTIELFILGGASIVIGPGGFLAFQFS
jgi:hypothetical protein